MSERQVQTFQQQKDQIIGEAIGQDMAQVKEMFNESGFFETANKLQQQLEENRKVSGGRATAKETVVEVHDSIKKKDGGQSHTENRDRIALAGRGKKSKIPVLIRSSISQSDVTIYDTAVKGCYQEDQ